MVIQVQQQLTEVTPHMEQKSNKFGKNYVPEVNLNNMDTSSEGKTTKRKKKLRKYESVNYEFTVSPGTDTEQNTEKHVSEINPSDLEELRSIYKKCKAVIKKLETKYGHLLDLDNDGLSSRKHKAKDKGYVDECYCGMNKKIIFDEDGQQVEKETTLECHICPKRLKTDNKMQEVTSTNLDQNLTIQHEEMIVDLPDDLPTLSKMLQDPEISITHRNVVIAKMKTIKNELYNELRFMKPSLKEKSKSNPHEIFEFAGTNLFSLPGYPDRNT